MPSAWITHVKQYAKDHNITYRDALKKLVQLIKKLNKNLDIFQTNFYIKYLKIFNI